jgi:hypothetical protein
MRVRSETVTVDVREKERETVYKSRVGVFLQSLDEIKPRRNVQLQSSNGFFSHIHSSSSFNKPGQSVCQSSSRSKRQSFHPFACRIICSILYPFKIHWSILHGCVDLFWFLKNLEDLVWDRLKKYVFHATPRTYATKRAILYLVHVSQRGEPAIPFPLCQ